MSSLTFFLFFIPILASILLLVNFILAPHKPNRDKDSQFECGFSSFTQMSRLPFSISFFIYALLFLLFDLEILLVYPYVVSAYNNSVYGLIVMLVFFTLLTIGFIFELGKKALQIDSRQTVKELKNIKDGTSQCFDILAHKNKPSKSKVLITNMKSSLIKVFNNILIEVHSIPDLVRTFINKYGILRGLIIILLIIMFLIFSMLTAPIIYCDSDSEETAKWKGRSVHKESCPQPHKSDSDSESESELEFENESESQDKSKSEPEDGSKSLDKSEPIDRSESVGRSEYVDKSEPLDKPEPESKSKSKFEDESKPEDKSKSQPGCKPESESESKVDKDIDVTNDSPKLNDEAVPSAKSLGKRKRVEPDHESEDESSSDDSEVERATKRQLDEDLYKAIRASLAEPKYGESSKDPVDQEYIGDADGDADPDDGNDSATSVYSSLNGNDSPDTYNKKIELLQRDEFILEHQRRTYYDDDEK